MISVALADDQTLVRQGIKSLLDLTPDLRVVAEASAGDIQTAGHRNRLCGYENGKHDR